MPVRPFEIRVPDSTLADLHARLAATRHVPDDASDWDAGASPVYMRELTEYWKSEFDWREQEKALNRFSHFTAKVGDGEVHFIHERGQGEAPLPLLLTHGYPDTMLRFLKIIPQLANPAAFGGDSRDAFDVVVPSLPGYGFSDPPSKPGGLFHAGDLWHELMTGVLGYDRFGAQGGDWGSTITEHIARSHSRSVVGIHLTDIPFYHSFSKPKDVTPAEQAYLDRISRYQEEEGAYAVIQGTRPQTLADGLNDSPVGLAAWTVEKFQRWSDCGGDIEKRFTKDELLSNITMTWATGSIGTSFLPYYDVLHAGAARWMVEMAKTWVGSSDVPAAFALFPKDLSHPPREWAERFYNVQRWTTMPSGGHYAAMEEPELLADDIRAFFRPMR